MYGVIRKSCPVQYACRPKNLLRLNMLRQRSIPKEDTKNLPLRFAFSKIHSTWSFHVVVLQRTAKKCTKIQNARAQLLFCSSNLLFGDVPCCCRRGLLKLPIISPWKGIEKKERKVITTWGIRIW